MNKEIKQCQNCRSDFTIEPEDFKFYQKIKVPPPTFCSACRFQRRLATLNTFSLYSRKCDLCKKDSVSMYSADAPYKVYCPECWYSDKWNPLDYGREYNFSRPFFEQFDEFLHEVPLIGLSIDLQTSREAPWNNHAGGLKNCYLLFNAEFSENSAYGAYITQVNECFDLMGVFQSELLFDSMHCYKNSRGVGLRNQVTNSLDCAFVRYAFNCQNCFASANLRNQKYVIFNKQYTKEAYFKEIEKWDLGSYKTYQEVKKMAEEHWKKFPPKPIQDEMSVNCSGSHYFYSKNCKQCFEVSEAEDSKFLWLVVRGIKDTYDVSNWGGNMALCYECCNVGENVSGIKFSEASGGDVYDIEYCKSIVGSSNLFGCVSLINKSYIIFNKQYSKDDYEKLREKIIQHMNEMPYRDKKGNIYQYGEFFPIEISPFGYNETIAANFFPLTKDEILQNGYKYKELDLKKHDETIKSSDLPDHIKDAQDSILNEVIKCAKCERGYRIIPMELKFLRERNFPLPRECPFCRIEKKFNQWVKNLRLIPRVCDKCGANFETEFTKEEAPVVYCKSCYQKEYV